MRTPLRTLALAAATLLAAQAQAATVGYAGTLTRDDEVRLLSFRVGALGNVRIETFGYAGGTDASGQAVAAGGFDPVFSLFRSDGTLVAYGDDGASRLDPVTNAAFDALLEIGLAAGDYFIALAQFDNFAIGPNFAAGFLESGRPTFTAAYGCSNGRFCDVNGYNRSGAFDISITGATVPEPATLALLGLVLPGLWATRRAGRRSPQPS